VREKSQKRRQKEVESGTYYQLVQTFECRQGQRDLSLRHNVQAGSGVRSDV